MSFVPPVWDSTHGHYVIELKAYFTETTISLINKDVNGNTVFSDSDSIENITDRVIHNLIDEGSAGKWFSKLPSHDQLVKRVRHNFKNLASSSENGAAVVTLLLTPKQITFLWIPRIVNPSTIPLISFDDSDDSSQGDEVDIPESDLPPVKLTDESEQTHEEYLLTRLRAAKARVEEEQIRMENFKITGKMPPDSDSEDE